MLVYGLLADMCNEYCKLRESIAFECVKGFVVAICTFFGFIYLKKSTYEDFEHKMEIK